VRNVFATADLVVKGIRHSLHGIAAADLLKREWAEKHSFRFKSFESSAELL